MWAVLAAVCMYPLSFCFYQSKPDDIGLSGEPVVETNEQDDDEFQRVEEAGEVEWTVSEVIKTVPFWVLMFVACELGAVSTAMTFYIRDIGLAAGITEL